ncbi:peptide chain release factor N(5)-glutamine methyltransferase [Marinimicrobium alkaliphilum]|uniref:peptide chain release factor N(5)-glutamine methyltransferase n=1 Tax=Marinimicrobium alkaliphilum TaxID=2202654 RepID=UPI000DBA5D36|nr:peptide chain release factor N(5)-glutamine methyltransferase [Marinimicrobium alkaliphilum]
MTIAECLRRAAELASVSDSPRLDAELLLCRVLERERTYLYTWPERELSASQAQAFDMLWQRRRRGEPVAHILGVREFWSLPLQVDASTLIPRPDTECLVEAALALTADDDPQARRRVLDLGTGTGAIALALASEKPRWSLLGIDRAPEAVALAERNRAALGLANAVFLESDWFAQVPPVPGFDVIVSNPPYIAEGDPHLTQGDVRFEPHSALVAAEQGLADLRHLIDRARDFLLPEGWLLLEHGFAQGEAVRALMATADYRSVASCADLGGQERVTLGQTPGGNA